MSSPRPNFNYAELEKKIEYSEPTKAYSNIFYYCDAIAAEQEKRETPLVDIIEELPLTQQEKLKEIQSSFEKSGLGAFFADKNSNNISSLKTANFKQSLRKLQSFDSVVAQIILEEKSKPNLGNSEKLEEKFGISFEKTPHIMVSALLDQERDRLVKKYGLLSERPDEKGNMTFAVNNSTKNKNQAQIAATRVKAIEELANKIRNSSDFNKLDLKKELGHLKQSMRSTSKLGNWFADLFVTSRKNIDKIIEVAKENNINLSPRSTRSL